MYSNMHMYWHLGVHVVYVHVYTVYYTSTVYTCTCIMVWCTCTCLHFWYMHVCTCTVLYLYLYGDGLILLPHCRVPECVASLTSLTHLYMNDIALPALPREIGKWAPTDYTDRHFRVDNYNIYIYILLYTVKCWYYHVVILCCFLQSAEPGGAGGTGEHAQKDSSVSNQQCCCCSVVLPCLCPTPPVHDDTSVLYVHGTTLYITLLSQATGCQKV